MKITAIGSVLLALMAAACSGTNGHESGERGEHARERGHDRDGGHGGEHGREGGEEDGTEYALDATYDKVRNGAHLTLAYEASSKSFVGVVENTTDRALEQVPVEVHLSNGKELGPTAAADLAPGAKRAIKLDAAGHEFERWTAHPEVGRNEHGHEGGEHGGRERGEHGGRE